MVVRCHRRVARKVPSSASVGDELGETRPRAGMRHQDADTVQWERSREAEGAEGAGVGSARLLPRRR